MHITLNTKTPFGEVLASACGQSAVPVRTAQPVQHMAGPCYRLAHELLPMRQLSVLARFVEDKLTLPSGHGLPYLNTTGLWIPTECVLSGPRPAGEFELPAESID